MFVIFRQVHVFGKSYIGDGRFHGLFVLLVVAKAIDGQRDVVVWRELFNPSNKQILWPVILLGNI